MGAPDGCVTPLVVVSVVRRMSEVTLPRARVLGWVTVCGSVYQPTRLTQPCIPSGSLNCVPAQFGWVKGGNVTFVGWQVTLCDPIWHVSFRNGEA